MLKRDGKAYLPAAAAAEALGTTHLKVLMLLREQKLSGEMVDGVWYISEQSLDDYVPAPATTTCRSNCTSGCGSC